MTKIYCYCLFDGNGNFHGAYSSATAVHRDALKMCNKGRGSVVMEVGGDHIPPSITTLRNTFKGMVDVQVVYLGHRGHQARIIKTKLKE